LLSDGSSRSNDPMDFLSLTDQSIKNELNEEERNEKEEQKKKDKVHEVLSKRKDFKGFTKKDIASLNDDLSLKYDTRTFCDYFKDILLFEHPVLSLIYFKSLMEPLILRIAHLFFTLSVNLALNALFYSDNYIEERSNVVLSPISSVII